MCDSVPERFLSSSTLAKAFEVSESSIKRWIDTGKIRAEKTPGGHRRVSVQDAYDFIQRNGKKIVNPEYLDVDTDNEIKKLTKEQVIEKIYDYLKREKPFNIFEIVKQLKQKELLESEIACDYLLAAYAKLRGECEYPSEECSVLHRSFEIIRLSLNEFNRSLSSKAQKEKKIVLADVGLEVDSLPLYAAETCCSQEGFETIQLGNKLPIEVLLGTILKYSPDFIWISAKQISNKSETKQMLEKMSEEIRENTKICLYGDAWEASASKLTSNFFRIQSLDEWRGFLKGLTI